MCLGNQPRDPRDRPRPRLRHGNSTPAVLVPLPWKNILRWVACCHCVDGGGSSQFDEGGVLRGVGKRRLDYRWTQIILFRASSQQIVVKKNKTDFTF